MPQASGKKKELTRKAATKSRKRPIRSKAKKIAQEEANEMTLRVWERIYAKRDKFGKVT